VRTITAGTRLITVGQLWVGSRCCRLLPQIFNFFAAQQEEETGVAAGMDDLCQDSLTRASWGPKRPSEPPTLNRSIWSPGWGAPGHPKHVDWMTQKMSCTVISGRGT
jgi:hypothetical protein